jgi:hypothetical protein
MGTIPGKRPAGQAWFFNPGLDLLLMANLAWPLVALAAWWTWSGPAHETIRLWQAYFLVTPHRWVTLVLVFFDRDRFDGRPRAFVGLAVAFAAACGLGYAVWGLEGLLVMMAADYLWNAWHFASQHAGVYRIYGRMSRPDLPPAGPLDKLLIRVFVTYVFLRMLGVISMQAFDRPHTAWLKDLCRSVPLELRWLDVAVLLLPVLILARDLRDYRPSMRGRLVYLGSCGLMYSLILVGFRARDGGVAGVESAILALFFTSAVYHATEYMAIVSWTAKRNRSPRGIIRHLAPRWLAFLLCFMGVLFVTSLLLMETEISRRYNLVHLWVLTNLVVSLLHYAYDGLIWRAPARPAAALPATG